jgi:DNA-binding beta-propeller fold protein YncE
MPLRLEGYIDLPESKGQGGFDHAAIHRGRRRLYVAHTANDAIDVIDLDAGRCVDSIGGLTGVAGALVSEDADLVFTSNRGENSVGIFNPARPEGLTKVWVGIRPNGLAYDHSRGTLLAANVGDPSVPGTHTVSIVSVQDRSLIGSLEVPGRTRWTVYDPVADAFYVNIADPAVIIVVGAGDPSRVSRSIAVGAAGPHGLDVDEAGRLYCACDAGVLFALQPDAVDPIAALPLSGTPDVIFLDRALDRLYVAIGDPGVVVVFDTAALRHIETVPTERGAHTIALDPDDHRVYAFLPATHRAAVFREVG